MRRHIVKWKKKNVHILLGSAAVVMAVVLSTQTSQFLPLLTICSASLPVLAALYILYLRRYQPCLCCHGKRKLDGMETYTKLEFKARNCYACGGRGLAIRAHRLYNLGLRMHQLRKTCRQQLLQLIKARTAYEHNFRYNPATITDALLQSHLQSLEVAEAKHRLLLMKMNFYHKVERQAFIYLYRLDQAKRMAAFQKSLNPLGRQETSELSEAHHISDDLQQLEDNFQARLEALQSPILAELEEFKKEWEAVDREFDKAEQELEAAESASP